MNTKEIIKHQCFSTGRPAVSITQFFYDFELKAPERINYVCSFIPSSDTLDTPYLVAIFKVTPKKNQNVSN